MGGKFIFNLISYPFIVEKQPIGRLLFKRFCEQQKQEDLAICWRFLERVEEYETSGKERENFI